MPALLNEYTSDFSRGMVDDVAATRYPSNAAAEILNGRIQPDATVRRRTGSIRTHPTSLGEIGYGAIEYTPSDGANAGIPRIVAFFDGSAFESTDSGATWSAALATGLREDYWTFAILREGTKTYLFAANGGTTVQRYDGTTWDTIPGYPSGVKFLANYEGRLWFTGHSGVLVQAARIGTHTSYASPFGLLVQVSELPTGLGQAGGNLLVYGRNSIAYVNGYGQQTLQVEVGETGFSRSIGCTAFRTIVSVGETGLAWLSQRGVEYYEAGVGIRLVTSPGLQRFLQTLDRQQIEENPGVPSAVYDDTTQEYHCAVPIEGTRNNKLIIVNLRQRGQGWTGACSVDEQQATGEPLSEILFSTSPDAEGYLQEDVAGVRLGVDADGYAELAAVGDLTVAPTEEDAQGYLATAVTDDIAATLFAAAGANAPRVVHSLGYDGFVRRHEDQDFDDVHSDGTGGLDVELSITGRPFQYRSAKQRKRAREVEVSVIADAPSTITVAVIADGVVLQERTIAIPSTAQNQPKRRAAMVNAKGDAPQVQVRSTDDVRIALLALSAELLREPR